MDDKAPPNWKHAKVKWASEILAQSPGRAPKESDLKIWWLEEQERKRKEGGKVDQG